MASPVEKLRDSCATTMNLWDQIRLQLQKSISQQNYDNWFASTVFAGVQGDTLLVRVPDNGTRALIEAEYGSIVLRAARELALPVSRIHYEAQALSGSMNQA